MTRKSLGIFPKEKNRKGQEISRARIRDKKKERSERDEDMEYLQVRKGSPGYRDN